MNAETLERITEGPKPLRENWAMEKTDAFTNEAKRVAAIRPKSRVGCIKCDGYGNRFDQNGNFVGLCDCRNRPRVAFFRKCYRDSVRLANPAVVDQINLLTDHFPTVSAFMAEWRKNHPATPSGMILGPPATGKSMSAHIVAEKIIQKQMIPGAFIDCRDLALKIPRQVEDMAAKNYLSRVNDWVGNPRNVLVVDQLGSEVTRETAVARVAEIVQRRFDLGARTILVSNLSRGDLVKIYGESWFDRIFGGKWAWIFQAEKLK